MPIIKVSGLDIPRVKTLSAEITDDLAKAIDCPTDWITFTVGALGDGNIFCMGELVKDTVYVHVEWFDRGAETKTAVAKIITDAVLQTKRIKSTKIETVDVIFVNLEKSDYYENGEHF